MSTIGGKQPLNLSHSGVVLAGPALDFLDWFFLDPPSPAPASLPSSLDCELSHSTPASIKDKTARIRARDLVFPHHANLSGCQKHAVDADELERSLRPRATWKAPKVKAWLESMNGRQLPSQETFDEFHATLDAAWKAMPWGEKVPFLIEDRDKDPSLWERYQEEMLRGTRPGELSAAFKERNELRKLAECRAYNMRNNVAGRKVPRPTIFGIKHVADLSICLKSEPTNAGGRRESWTRSRVDIGDAAD